MLRAALTGGYITDLESPALLGTVLPLLREMAEDAQLTDVELDEFLTVARREADRLLGVAGEP